MKKYQKNARNCLHIMRKSGIIGTIFNKGIKGNVMAYIKDEEINEIRSRANIVDIISGYLQVSQKGKNYVSLCPFHNDHSPSLIISPEKQIFNCLRVEPVEMFFRLL